MQIPKYNEEMFVTDDDADSVIELSEISLVPKILHEQEGVSIVKISMFTDKVAFLILSL